MMSQTKTLINGLLGRVGYRLCKVDPRQAARGDLPRDLDEEDLRIIRAVRPHTLTSVERIRAVMEAVRYLEKNEVAGDIVECGVWRGGSMMAIAHTLLAGRPGPATRDLYLYDTFEGMSPPTARDRSMDGKSASEQLAQAPPGTGIWAYASLEDVRQNMASTAYPAERVHLIQGRVEETIPRVCPARVALLRLDTDWYESTKHELEHLYPRLVRGGILIIDDYGHWQGSKAATDEYFGARKPGVFLHRIDYTARLVVKAE